MQVNQTEFVAKLQHHYDHIYNIYFDDRENNQELTLEQWFEVFKVYAAVQAMEEYLQQDKYLAEEQLLPLLDEWVIETFKKEKLMYLVAGEHS